MVTMVKMSFDGWHKVLIDPKVEPARGEWLYRFDNGSHVWFA